MLACWWCLLFLLPARGRCFGRRHMIDTHTMKVTPNVYCLGDRTGSKCEDVQGTCLTTETFMGPRGRRMLVTSHSLAEVGAVLSCHFVVHAFLGRTGSAAVFQAARE